MENVENNVNVTPVSSQKAVTTVSDLEKYAKGCLVELPPFAEGQPFVARIKRPSMLMLVKSGKIPNSLLTTANSLFTGKGDAFDVDNEKQLDNVFGVIEVLCESAFVEPTYEQIKSSGLELTDDQMMFVFNYSQKGTKMLENFR